MITARVDGNDVFAVYNVTKATRAICIRESRPILIEAMMIPARVDGNNVFAVFMLPKQPEICMYQRE